MNRAVLSAILVLALAGCGRTGRHETAESPPPPASQPAPRDAAFLAAHPGLLADVHRRCKAREPDATPALCAEAAEATRLRFTGGPSVYAPKPVQPFADRNDRP